jgi:hypothetical protein
MNGSSLPSLIQRFFTDRLLVQLGASSCTVAAYRDAFRLLFQYATATLRRAPSDLRIERSRRFVLGEVSRTSRIRTDQLHSDAEQSFIRAARVLPLRGSQ